MKDRARVSSFGKEEKTRRITARETIPSRASKRHGRCRARYLELAAVEEDAGVYDAGKGSLENLTKQRIDLVMEQLAGDRSNQKSGASSYRGMRPLGPSGVSERGRQGDERMEKSSSPSIHGRRSRDSRDRRRPRKERMSWIEHRTAER